MDRHNHGRSFPALAAVQIGYSYQQNDKKRQLFDQLSLSLAKDQVLALIGKSGCGKTTFLQLLAGILAPESGYICVDGKQHRTPGYASYVPQQPHLLPWLRLLDNLLLPLQLRSSWLKFGTKMLNSNQQQLLHHLLNEFGLAESVHLYPHQLSGGMQQRVSLLRGYLHASIHGNNILLLDEPLAALDAITRESMQHWLAQRLWEGKATSLLVTHDIEEALLLGDTVLLMYGLPARLITFSPHIPRECRFSQRRTPPFIAWQQKIIHALQQQGATNQHIPSGKKV